MTNALVEIALIATSLVVGLMGFPILALAIMVGMSLAWWGFVHHTRLSAMIKVAPINALGTLAIGLILMAFGHGVAFALGYAGHQILGNL